MPSIMCQILNHNEGPTGEVRHAHRRWAETVIVAGVTPPLIPILTAPRTNHSTVLRPHAVSFHWVWPALDVGGGQLRLERKWIIVRPRSFSADSIGSSSTAKELDLANEGRFTVFLMVGLKPLFVVWHCKILKAG